MTTEELKTAGSTTNLDKASNRGFIKSMVQGIIKMFAKLMEKAKPLFAWLGSSEKVGWMQSITSWLATIGNAASALAKVLMNCLRGIGALVASIDIGMTFACVSQVTAQKRRIDRAMRKMAHLIEYNKYVARLLRSIDDNNPNSEVVRGWAFARIHQNTVKMYAALLHAYPLVTG